MSLFKRILSAVVTFAVMAGMLSACGHKQNNSGGSSAEIDQLGTPEKGQQIATIKVKDYGKIKLMFFPEVAPKAVENFTKLAEKKYYDGLLFHRVMKDFMAQTGDPTGTGMGGESIWGEGFEVEYDGRLRHYSGAVGCARTAQPKSIGSQFYIVDNTLPVDDTIYDGIIGYAKQNGYNVDFSDDVKANYKKISGAPHLDGNYTVFAQVYEGLDIVEKIMQQETDQNDKPVTPVYIDAVTISKYNDK